MNRVEYALSGKSVCRECRSFIGVGELRVGTVVEAETRFLLLRFRHLLCFFKPGRACAVPAGVAALRETDARAVLELAAGRTPARFWPQDEQYLLSDFALQVMAAPASAPALPKSLEQVKSSSGLLLGVVHGLLRDGTVTPAHLAEQAQACSDAKADLARVLATFQQVTPDTALLRRAADASAAVDIVEAEVCTPVGGSGCPAGLRGSLQPADASTQRLRLATAAAAISCATNLLAPLKATSTMSACLGCHELSASVASLICAHGHAMCASCFTGLLTSRLGSALSTSVLSCTGLRSFSYFSHIPRSCTAPPFTLEAAQRMLIYGLPAAAADPALKSLNLLLEAQTRHAVTRELKRKPPTLESQLIDAATLVRCSECDAPYGAGPDACMHAVCACGHKFCAFCWQPQSQCRTEQCIFNPRPGTIHCTNKAVAFSVIKALNIAELLRSLPAAQRIAALDSPAVIAAFASADLDAALPHLVVDAGGYLHSPLRATLAARYAA